MNTKTVLLKIITDGILTLAHPHASPGPKSLVYAIDSVPSDISPSAVCLHVGKIALVHPHDGPENWRYRWPELVNLTAGAIVNRYQRQPTI